MAKAYKCDICLKYYDTSSNLKISGSKLPCLCISKANSNIIDRVDICPSCNNAIQNTIDSRCNMRTTIDLKEKET